MLAGQALELAILTPNIIGSEIGLHPVWVIFALLSFSYLFGFLGLLVAVPVSAAIGVLVRFALRTYLQSSVYQGERAARRISLDTPHAVDAGTTRLRTSASRRDGPRRFSRVGFERRRRGARRSLAGLADGRRRDCRSERQRQNTSRQCLADCAPPPRVFDASQISREDVPAIASAGAAIIEDVQNLTDEAALFHLLNLVREQRLQILMTTNIAPGDLSVSLPDLMSRLKALPVASIEAPDDALLRAVLVKLFADRQLSVEPHVIDYVLVRMERSLAAAERLVAEADRQALVLQRRVTRAVAAAALDKLGY